MSAVTSNIGFAEAQALKRRERILKLRKKVEGKSEDEEIKDQDSQSPRDELNNESDSDPVEPQRTEDNPVKDSILDEELDLNQLAPRKIDWDLKRGIERKLDILQEATNNAILELIRDDKVEDVQV